MFRVLGVALVVGVASAQTGPVHNVITDQLDSPVSMTVAPDGRVFVAEQAGRLRVIRDDVLLPAPFVTVPTIADDEEGLLAAAFDPAFAQNGFVYVLYTAVTPVRRNVVGRYRAQGDVAAPQSGVVLFELSPLQAHFHVGGGFAFGSDGRLYIGTGDNGSPFHAGNLGSTHGKVLRIAADGGIPADNPFFATAAGNARAIWCLGFRNAFGLALQPGSGRLFVDDVGAANWEEVNEVARGVDFGWPGYEGPAGAPGFRDPLHAYGHASGCAITGGVFAPHLGRYLYAEYCRNEIRAIDPQNPAASQVLAGTVVAGPVDVAVAPGGAICYLARGNSQPSGGPHVPGGALVRIEPAAAAALVGTGCPSGTAPTLATNGLPRLGAAGFACVIGNLPGPAAGLLLGTGNASSPLGPLPLELAAFGMPGCLLHTSAEVLLLAVATGSSAAFPQPIPAQPALLGARVFVQGVAGAPGANAAGLLMTPGLALTLGR